MAIRDTQRLGNGISVSGVEQYQWNQFQLRT